jgi:SAM-dependent methyltransferase
VSRNGAAGRIAAQYDSRFLRYYVRSKLATDPLYRAVGRHLREQANPIVDVGCGIGLMAFWLREHGFTLPITAFDHDSSKVDVARRIAANYSDVTLLVGDARAPLPAGHSVLLLDTLQYFASEDQVRILRNASAAVPNGGVVIIRGGVRDSTWRYGVTYAVEALARGVGWLKAERVNFPTRASIETAFDGFEAHFQTHVEPLWGVTPFNNYLFVLKRSGGGMTNV